MYTHVFKEINPENIDTSFYFDCDCFNENSGNYCYTLFIICDNNRHSLYGINAEEYKNVIDSIEMLFNDFEYAEDNKDYTFKQAIIENGLKYNSTTCHKLKELYFACYHDGNGTIDCDTIAEYLTITTGETWLTTCVYGYSQGDYADIVYCNKYYTEDSAKTHGNVFLGCCKEFSLTEIDKNGQEDDTTTCYGYYIADNEYHNDNDIKKVLCEYEGLKPEETKVLLIDYNTMHTYTKYQYEYTEI